MAAQQNIVGAVREYGKRLFGFIRNRVTTDADAEDVLQDVWYQLSRVADAEPIEELSGWLFRVARNRITDRYRKKKEDSLEALAYENEEGESYFKDLLLSTPDTPESEYLRQLFWEELMLALEELPEAQRNVFVWNELEDQTLQEIADKSGESIKTIISRKRYAVQHLRRQLDTLYQEFFIS